MINYNLVDSAKYGSLLMHVIIYFLLVVGLYLSVLVLKPKYLGWGKVFMEALIWFSTHITLSLIFLKNPIIVTILAPLAWFFETKFLWEHSWTKAVIAWIITIVIVIAGLAIAYFVSPEFFKATLGVKLI